jgi:hypothetical protein
MYGSSGGAYRLSLSLFLCNNDYETTGSFQDPVVRLPLMEAELAILREDSSNDRNQQKQQALQEDIANAKTAAEFGVRKAQLEFYDAFSRGDIELMGRIWSRQSHVRCVHPGMNSLEGRDNVMASWRQIFQSGGDGKEDDLFEIEPIRSHVEVHGLIVQLCGKDKRRW